MAMQSATLVRRWRVRLPFRQPWQGLTYRDATIVGGPKGFGEASPLPGFPCDPVRALRSAEEAALEGWPHPVRRQVPVNAVVPPTPPSEAAAVALEATRQGIT